MSEASLGIYLIIALMAMAVSMAIIPLMMRIAPAIGMVDHPDPRKVHAVPVPRVGGVGIVAGALIPLFIWMPFDSLTLSFLIGSIILLVFGVWDDAKELGHYVKFSGQFIAAMVVVYYGGLYVSHFPFIGTDLLPESIGKPFTVIAIVGMINAVNHSDGLDGLAGGESLLSLASIAYLAFLYDSALIVIIAAASIGGVFGFLRFNSHPARVFMGDGGSQFLGFALAFLVIVLTQQANEVLSPALPLLLLGLPIADIIAVFVLRARGGMNLFKATRNHIHHRLLELGFYHFEAVIIIYSIQILFIVCAILMPYGYDWAIISIYLLVCAVIFSALTYAERSGWKVNRAHVYSNNLISRIPHKKILIKFSHTALESSVALFLLGSALMSNEIPIDIGISSLILLLVLLIVLFSRRKSEFVYRLVIFITIGFSVYLLSTYSPGWLLNQVHIIYIYFGLVTLFVFINARLIIGERFQITPLDYLVIMMALIIGFIKESGLESAGIVWMAIQLIILFYASELTIQNTMKRLNSLTVAAIITLVMISLRALV